MIISTSILASCKRKEEKGYKALYRHSLPYVFSIVRRYIIREEERKDIVQEIFATVFLRINHFDPAKGAFKYWLRKIAVNQCLMYLRKEKRLKHLVPLDAIDENKYAEEMRFDALSKTMIERLLSKMPEGYKTIFLLTIIDEFTHSEVGKMLNISPETSRSQLSRAKVWIKNRLHQDTKLKANGLF
ncbi:MAG: sigma-70 family RNA polymerase sigma factor [Bacteroidota bacterium]